MKRHLFHTLLMSLLFSSVFGQSIGLAEYNDAGDQEEENFYDEMDNDAEVASRRGKLFNFFDGMTTFENVLAQTKGNVRCIVDSGDRLKERHGVCTTKSNCRQMAGTNSERSCNYKFGFTCCILNATCSRSKDVVTIKKNYVYLRHETNQQECLTDYKFPRQPGVCQLKLEFKQFNLSPPNNTGNCVSDKMSIRRAQNLPNNLVLCGKANETDHLYLQYGESNEINVNLDVAQQPNYGEVEILVRQIKCDSADLAPEGCGQYFIQQRGDVRSFNFDRAVGQQLNNHMYSVCVKGDAGSTGISWSTCTGSSEEFEISNSLGSNNCPHDSVTIPGSEPGKYCTVGSLNVARTMARPYVMYVHFNDFELIPIPPAPIPGECPPPNWMEEPGTGHCVPSPTAPIADLNNRGFCLRYQRG